MTEEMLERAVERRIDALDTRLITNDPPITQAEYDTALAAIYECADRQRAALEQRNVKL